MVHQYAASAYDSRDVTRLRDRLCYLALYSLAVKPPLSKTLTISISVYIYIYPYVYILLYVFCIVQLIGSHKRETNLGGCLQISQFKQ